MSYEINVKALCDKRGIKNPIQEEDLHIAAIVFTVGEDAIQIDASRTNRGARLFFEYYFGDMNRKIGAKDEVTDRIFERAKEYFAERWEDAEEKGRPFLIALKKASHFEIFWKPLNDGEDTLCDE